MTGHMSVLAFIGGIRGPELVVILVVILLLFGAHKIPEFARSLGRAQREFQNAREEGEREAKASVSTEEEKVKRAARDLGISTQGKSLEELKQAIAQRMAPANVSP